MKKIFALFLLSAIGVSSAVAQESDERVNEVVVSTNAFRDNWFVSVGGGAMYFNGNYASDIDFGKHLSPALDVMVGKWITPTVGVRGGIRGLNLQTQSATKNFASGDLENGLYDQKYKVTNIVANFMLNASNLFYGYKESQLYDCIPYLGFGLLEGFNECGTNLTANIGLLNSFNISPKFNIYFDASASAFKNNFVSSNVTRDYYISATIGLTYKINGGDFKRVPEPPIVYTGISEADFAELSNKLTAEQVKVADLNDEVKVAKKAAKKAEAEAIKEAASPILITFGFDESKLNNLALVNLDYYAQGIKASGKGAKFVVTGYADVYTGTAKVNENISRERAEAVYNALIEKFGVPASKLKMEYKGGVKNMYYNDRKLSRAALIQPIK